jgi:hypothetical protein
LVTFDLSQLSRWRSWFQRTQLLTCMHQSFQEVGLAGSCEH